LQPSPLPEVASAPQPELARTPSLPRWVRVLAVAVAGVIGVSGVAAGAALVYGLLTGQVHDGARAGYAYLPATTTVVVEARLDLPAGQNEQLAMFLTRFPGFDDAAQVEERLNELLNDAVREGTDGRANFVDDVQPWLVGWVVIGTSQNLGSVLPGLGGSSGLAVAGLSDRAAAEEAMLDLRSTDMEWTANDEGGTVIWTGRPEWYGEWPSVDVDEMPWLDELADFGGQAYAVTDDALLFANRADDIRFALAVRAGESSSLLTSNRFNDALRRAPAGRLGMVWADVEGMGIATLLDRLTGDSPFGEILGPACGEPSDALPRDVLATLQLRDGRAIVDVNLTLPETPPVGSVRESDLAARVPADAFFYAEAHDVGVAVSEALACLRSMGDDGGLLEDIEETTGQLDDLLGWATDVGLALRFDGTRVSAGVVARVDDQVRAAEALGQLRAFLTAGAGALGGVTVAEEDYRGVRLVTFAFSDTDAGMPAPAPAPTLAYALAGDLLVIGVDAGFTRAVLDTEGGSGLAATERFSRAIDIADGRRNRGLVYVDVPTALEFYEALDRLMPGRSRDTAEFDEYMAALSDVIIVSGGEGSNSTLRIVLNTREQP